jgi:hypothetical protein
MMSFLDRLKSLFSGGSSPPDDHAGHSHDAPRTGESNLEASAGLPPSPVDPLGSPAPEAAPDPVTPPPPPPPPSDPDKL